MMNGTFGVANCVIGAIVIVLVVFLVSAIRIVPEFKRLVVFRLGRCIGAKGPGIILLIPVLDKAVTVDLRELVREIPTQTAITLDNAQIGRAHV